MISYWYYRDHWLPRSEATGAGSKFHWIQSLSISTAVGAGSTSHWIQSPPRYPYTRELDPRPIGFRARICCTIEGKSVRDFAKGFRRFEPVTLQSLYVHPFSFLFLFLFFSFLFFSFFKTWGTRGSRRGCSLVVSSSSRPTLHYGGSWS